MKCILFYMVLALTLFSTESSAIAPSESLTSNIEVDKSTKTKGKKATKPKTINKKENDVKKVIKGKKATKPQKINKVSLLIKVFESTLWLGCNDKLISKSIEEWSHT